MVPGDDGEGPYRSHAHHLERRVLELEARNRLLRTVIVRSRMRSAGRVFRSVAVLSAVAAISAAGSASVFSNCGNVPDRAAVEESKVVVEVVHYLEPPILIRGRVEEPYPALELDLEGIELGQDGDTFINFSIAGAASLADWELCARHGCVQPAEIPRRRSRR